MTVQMRLERGKIDQAAGTVDFVRYAGHWTVDQKITISAEDYLALGSPLEVLVTVS